jgi:hypothetical protein
MWVGLGKTLAYLSVASLLALGLLYGIAAHHRARAQAFLREFGGLRLGESTLADAEQIARDYKGIPWYVTPDDMRCTFQDCALAFKFENTPLSYVPFFHHTVCFGLILVKDGIVVGRQLEYERNVPPDHYFKYLVLDSVRRSENDDVTWRLKVDQEGLAHVVEVHLSPVSSNLERKLAYSVDLSCLAKLYDCSAPSAIYPPGTPYWGPPYQNYAPNK